MGKPSKTAGAEEEEKVYATSSEVEDFKRSVEALKKVQEESNSQMQLQMDKLMGAMANFMNSPTTRELSEKQSSCQGNFRNPATSLQPSSLVGHMDVRIGGRENSVAAVVTTMDMRQIWYHRLLLALTQTFHREVLAPIQ